MFTEALDSFVEEESKKFIQENLTRLRQYFYLSVVTFGLLLFSNEIHLSRIEKWVGTYVVLNSLLVCVMFHSVKSYIEDNFEAIKREFSPLAYSKKVLTAINENKDFNENYEKPDGDRRFNLERKPNREYCPERIRIDVAFHWNQTLGQLALTDTLKMWNEKYKARKLFDNTLFITNIEPTSQMTYLMESLDGLTYIYATNEQEIFSRLEESWYILYSRHRKNSRKAIEEKNSTQ